MITVYLSFIYLSLSLSLFNPFFQTCRCRSLYILHLHFYLTFPPPPLLPSHKPPIPLTFSPFNLGLFPRFAIVQKRDNNSKMKKNFSCNRRVFFKFNITKKIFRQKKKFNQRKVLFFSLAKWNDFIQTTQYRNILIWI